MAGRASSAISPGCRLSHLRSTLWRAASRTNLVQIPSRSWSAKPQSVRRKEMTGCAVSSILSKQKTEHTIGHLTERRADHIGEIPFGLREYALGMTQRPKPFLAVIGTHATGSYATKR